MRKVIIGLGTGRCGTTTLAHLLNIQDGCSCTHERLDVSLVRGKNWFRKSVVPSTALMVLDDLANRKEPVVGDVACWWLDSIPLMLDYDGLDIRFICLKRDKEKTIDSLSRLYEKPIIPRIYKAMEKYYDDYYKDFGKYAWKHPESFAIFSTENLNSLDGQKEILNFAGFKNHQYDVGKRLNKRGKPDEAFVDYWNRVRMAVRSLQRGESVGDYPFSVKPLGS